MKDILQMTKRNKPEKAVFVVCREEIEDYLDRSIFETDWRAYVDGASLDVSEMAIDLVRSVAQDFEDEYPAKDAA